MKKRIGTIYGSPIVEGDKNLKTSNEIHIDDLKGDGGSNNSSNRHLYFRWPMGENPFSSGFDSIAATFPAMTILYGNYNGKTGNNDGAFNIEMHHLMWGSGGDTDAEPIGMKIPNTSFLVPPAAQGQLPALDTVEDLLLWMEAQGLIGGSTLSKYRVSEEEYYEGCYTTLLSGA